MVISPLTVVLYIIAFIGVLGLVALIITPFVMIFVYIKQKRIAKRIPDKLKKEVENARAKRTNGLGEDGEGLGTSSSTDSSVRDERLDIQSNEVQRMDNDSNPKSKRRNKPNRFNPI